MKTLNNMSLHLMVKDEQAIIGPLLELLEPFMDEIVVIDTGSTDRTVEIARRHTDKIVECPLNMDFSAARNRGLEAVTKTWVFHVDADEWLSDGLLMWLEYFLSITNPGVGGAFIWRENLVGGEPIGKNTYELHPRVFRCGYRFQGRVHEKLNAPLDTFLRAPKEFLLLHHKSIKRQEKQNRFYQAWAEQRLLVREVRHLIPRSMRSRRQ